MKVVIVGAVAGGASAAARLRRLDEQAEIVLFERGPEPSFANCGLPYYVGGKIEARDKLLVAPIELLRRRHRLDVRTQTEVLGIDRRGRSVRVRELQTGREYREDYDKLILSPGAAPILPPIPGVESPGVHTLRSLADADRLRHSAEQARQAVIVGGGFIGLEVAENLARLGVETTLIERNSQVLTPWDAEMVTPISACLRKSGVDVRLREEVVGFEPLAERTRLRTSRGDSLDADLVLIAIGVRPDSRLATDAGLRTGDRGAIVVNEQMRTSDPDIFAVGDAVEVTHFVSGRATQIPLAGPANRQGRVAADACVDRVCAFNGVQGTAVVGVFDQTAAMTGLSEKACHALGFECEKVYLHPMNHAGYYPGAQAMTLKVLFDVDGGRILGAQAVGGEGVDKRIDVISMAIQSGMTVFDLEEAELCYAPQYGSAKDPVNLAGMIAAGVLRGDHPIVHAAEVIKVPDEEQAILIDVRTEAEFAAGAIPGAINIPLETLRDRLQEVPTDRRVMVYCQVGMRGYLATRVLLSAGRDALNLSGGYKSYLREVEARAVDAGYAA